MENTESTQIVHVTRVESFCASHRLHCQSLDDATNDEIFGKCNNPNGHGHNYKVEVTVKGPIDETTGMVMNLTQLKSIINNVTEIFDHKNIDKDIGYFRDNSIVSTAENIAVFIWNSIDKQLTNDVKLHCVKLHETDKNIVKYKGKRPV